MKQFEEIKYQSRSRIDRDERSKTARGHNRSLCRDRARNPMRETCSTRQCRSMQRFFAMHLSRRHSQFMFRAPLGLVDIVDQQRSQWIEWRAAVAPVFQLPVCRRRDLAALLVSPQRAGSGSSGDLFSIKREHRAPSAPRICGDEIIR